MKEDKEFQEFRDLMPRPTHFEDGFFDAFVSSDVIGNSCSLLFDLQGTIKAGRHTVKLLGWYESLGHAVRLLDVVRLYAELGTHAGVES